jgi:hypothetical protein
VALTTMAGFRLLLGKVEATPAAQPAQAAAA